MIEVRENGALRAISIIDCLSDGLSSVYTFYDPENRSAGYGTYAILWQIEVCKRVGLPYLYLGYWIRDSHKMSYKARFRPLEGRVDGEWRELSDEDFKRLG
jgi:arginine-tRNA-protein transferase